MKKTLMGTMIPIQPISRPDFDIKADSGKNLIARKGYMVYHKDKYCDFAEGIACSNLMIMLKITPLSLKSLV